MARVIKGSRSTKPVAKGRTSARTAPLARSAAKPAAKPRAAAAAPKLTITEMRAELEKLTKANATLRAKNRDLSKSTRTADATIAALKEQVTTLERELAAAGAPAKPAPKPRQPRRAAAKRDDAPMTVDPKPDNEMSDEEAESHESIS